MANVMQHVISLLYKNGEINKNQVYVAYKNKYITKEQAKLILGAYFDKLSKVAN